MFKTFTKTLALTILAAPSALADDATIEGATARQSGETWTFSVTLAHGDTGWDDYADGWRVVSESGKILGTRTLYHPHVNEQPFTRSLSGVALPADTKRIFIEASTNTDGWGAAQFELSLE